MKINGKMVEVFKTDVYEKSLAIDLLDQLTRHYPNHKINFDLDDCDKVLRIEGDDMELQGVKQIINKNGFACELLE